MRVAVDTIKKVQGAIGCLSSNAPVLYCPFCGSPSVYKTGGGAWACDDCKKWASVIDGDSLSEVEQ